MRSIPEDLSRMPSNEQHSNMFQPPQPSQPLFRPYNHFPTPAARGLNRLNTQLNGSRKSAFKPVARRSTKTISETKSIKCTAEPCFCHLSGVLNPTLAMANQLGSGTFLRDSYDSILNGGLEPSNYNPATQLLCNNIDTSYNSAKQQRTGELNNGQYLHRPAIQYQQMAQGNVVLMLCPNEFHLIIYIFFSFSKQTNLRKICTNGI